MRQESRQLFFLFFISVVIYGAVAFCFTSTVHIDVDEELYVALARSFHYRGRFEYRGQLQNYNCVLYSMLISLAYYIYSPDTILFVMRMMGVITLCSSVFPIYLLAKSVLEDGGKAVRLSCFLMIMPYMFDGAFLMQEVLSYPLFMWTLYFLYSYYRDGREPGKLRDLAAGAVFSVLCVFTKTYLFFIPMVVNLCFLPYARQKKNRKAYMAGIAVYDAVYLIFFGGIYFGIWAINGFETGSNHYSSQFSHLFPIGMDTVVCGIIAVIIYGAFYAVNTGIFPLGVIFHRWRREKNGSWLLLFLMTASLFLIVEIVFMIVLTEEGVGNLPHKFLFRYFQVFVPVIFVLFVKYKDEAEQDGVLYSREVRLLATAGLSIALIYFAYMRGNTRQAIMDGHLFLFLENATKHVLPYADVMGILALLLISGCIMCRRCGGFINMNRIVKFTVAAMSLFWVIQAVQLPYYTNVVAGGKEIQEDSIRIAEYINAEGYENICYVYGDAQERDSYLRNFYGYVKQPYQLVAKENLGNVTEGDHKSKTVFLLPKGSETEGSLSGLKEIDLQTKRLAAYRGESD